MDLCGPMRTKSLNKKKYIMVIVDDYTRFVRTDNGTEFVNKTLTDLFEQVGISHQTSVPRSSQQNGVVERRNRTLVKAARTMLIFAKASLFLWAEAVATACYTLNRSLIHTLHGKTYYALLKGKKPNLNYFRVFGALCYPTNDSQDLGKLKAKADIEGLPQHAVEGRPLIVTWVEGSAPCDGMLGTHQPSPLSGSCKQLRWVGSETGSGALNLHPVVCDGVVVAVEYAVMHPEGKTLSGMKRKNSSDDYGDGIPPGKNNQFRK
nr:hypothetical protein [Tanacetum cinerariifolium]